MPLTPEEASAFIESNGSVASHLAVAELMVNEYVGGEYVPDQVIDLAVLTLAQELQLRQRSPGGVMNFASADSTVRVSRDPMTPVYPLLRMYVEGLA